MTRYTLEDFQKARHRAQEADAQLALCRKKQVAKRTELEGKLRQVASEIQTLNDEIRPHMTEVFLAKNDFLFLRRRLLGPWRDMDEGFCLSLVYHDCIIQESTAWLRLKDMQWSVRIYPLDEPTFREIVLGPLLNEENEIVTNKVKVETLLVEMGYILSAPSV